MRTMSQTQRAPQATDITRAAVSMLPLKTQWVFALLCARHVAAQVFYKPRGGNQTNLCNDTSWLFLRNETDADDLTRAYVAAVEHSRIIAQTMRDHPEFQTLDGFMRRDAEVAASKAAAAAALLMVKGVEDLIGVVNVSAIARSSAAFLGNGMGAADERAWQVRTLNGLLDSDIDLNDPHNGRLRVSCSETVTQDEIEDGDFLDFNDADDVCLPYVMRCLRLDSLPVGSVVIDDAGVKWVRMGKTDGTLTWYQLGYGSYVEITTMTLARLNAREEAPEDSGDENVTSTPADAAPNTPRAVSGAYSRRRKARTRKFEGRYERRRVRRAAMKEGIEEDE